MNPSEPVRPGILANVSQTDIALEVDKILHEYGLQDHTLRNELKTEIDQLADRIFEDLLERIVQDPISESYELIYKHSRSFRAVFFYRIGNFLFYLEKGDLELRVAAFRLSERAALETGIEIHPGARIGRRFVIDHGLNTLIGATTEIGDNCTLLNNVLLGSRKITNNPNGKRHPTLGNNVKISTGVRVLGNIRIGDNCKIGPDCVIMEDIPNNSVVRLERSLKIKTRSRNKACPNNGQQLPEGHAHE